ncbi:hypothetical protein NLM16_05940 [Bradyrhizobium brasilense]|uniref:hypothetical protein n=1 Tax=Bradyrhizobium brasilense TaxID=1419277 RepID=UPI0035C6FB4C|nr:hypothetical protein [Bradyrhizobium brasilense]
MPKAFSGRWCIVEMTNRVSDFLNLVKEAHLTFDGKSDGEIAFGALKGFPLRSARRFASAEFSRGPRRERSRRLVVIGFAGKLVQRFYLYKRDCSGFVCEGS